MKPEVPSALFDEVPGLVVHFHLHEHVAREELAFAAALLPFRISTHFFGRHQDLAELVLQTHALDALFERLFTRCSKFE